MDKPLPADLCAAFARLLRHCAALRAGLGGEASDPALPALNVLILLAGAYFGQDPELGRLWVDD